MSSGRRFLYRKPAYWTAADDDHPRGRSECRRENLPCDALLIQVSVEDAEHDPTRTHV